MGRVLRRAGSALLTLVWLSVLLFLLVEILPGDAAERNLGPFATDEQVEATRQRLGLDEPLVARYVDWVSGLARGDLGESMTGEASIRSIVGDRLPNTLVLAGIALVAITLLSVVLGLITGTRPGSRLDVAVMGQSSFMLSLPEFVTASLLITVFAWQLDLFPPLVVLSPGGGILDRPEMLVLPVLSVVSLGVAAITRLVRAVVIDASTQPHVEAARLQGVSEREVLRRHLLPSVVGPVAQVIAFTVPFLIGGTVVIEYIFNYPGLATLLLDGVAARDAPMVEGLGMIFGAFVVGALFLADVVEILADPHQRAPRT